MENASKALLIAGAVLIVILLIGVGMIIYTGATDTINSSTGQMSAQQIQMQNQQFTSYEGEKISGTKVKSLISTIKANTASDDAFEMPYQTAGLNDTSTIKSSSKYLVKFYDRNSDGLLDGVFIQENNEGTVTAPATF